MSLVDRARELNRRRTTGVFIVGYPKTGNTWTRFLLGRYLERVCDLDEIPLFDGYDRWGRCQRACVGPGMYFTHQPLEWDGQTAADLSHDNVVAPFRRRRVVLITRYPLDALVSLWMQQRHRTAEGYEAGLAAFVDDPVFGLEKLMRFHQLWAAERDRPEGLHLVRYEDLRSDAAGGLVSMLRFLGIEVDAVAVPDAVEQSSFESMRSLELSGAAPPYRSSGLGVFGTGDGSSPDTLHVRKGTVGGYRELLSPTEAGTLEARVAAEFPGWYGYGSPPREDDDVG